MIKVCNICGKEFDTGKGSGSATKTYCQSEACIRIYRERKKEAQRMYARDWRKRTKSLKMERREKAKGNGWFCRYCGKELTGSRRYYHKRCEKIVCSGEEAPIMQGDWGYV